MSFGKKRHWLVFLFSVPKVHRTLANCNDASSRWRNCAGVQLAVTLLSGA